MARTVDASNRTELDSGAWREGRLIDLEWSTSTDYIWTGVGDLVFGGQTYKGLGDFLGMSDIVEDSDNVASGTEIRLSGIQSSNLFNALQNVEQGKEVTIRHATFDVNWNLIGTPTIIYEGRMDVPTIVKDGKTSYISITVEDFRIDLEKPNELRFTDQDQQSLFVGDLFCEYVTDNRRKSHWGQ